MTLGVENREGESLMENIFLEAMHDILESEDLDKAFDDCDKQPPCILSAYITNDAPPGLPIIYQGYTPEQVDYHNKMSSEFETEL